MSWIIVSLSVILLALVIGASAGRECPREKLGYRCRRGSGYRCECEW